MFFYLCEWTTKLEIRVLSNKVKCETKLQNVLQKS
jgi:hypothetical protein